jgi:hypothetical protein
MKNITYCSPTNILTYNKYKITLPYQYLNNAIRMKIYYLLKPYQYLNINKNENILPTEALPIFSYNAIRNEKKLQNNE